MARPRKLAVWEFEAMDLGLDPVIARRKMTTLRATKARKFDKTIAEMEAIYGWYIDDMGASLVHAVRHERCRGPRCDRIYFKNLPLELITCDILNPADPPFWCMNVRWACSKDNKGDKDRPAAWRMEQLLQARTIAAAATMPVVAWSQPELPLFDPG